MARRLQKALGKGRAGGMALGLARLGSRAPRQQGAPVLRVVPSGRGFPLQNLHPVPTLAFGDWRPGG
jgi:hypothetical protein